MKENLFSVPLSRLDPEARPPFPLFLYLEISNRVVPVRRRGDPIGRELYEKLASNGHRELWVPKEFAEAFDAFYRSAGKIPPGEREAELATIAPEPALLAAVPDREKTLAPPAGGLLEELKRITVAGEAALRPLAERLRLSVDALLETAAAEEPLYSAVLVLRSSLESTEHSVLTGSLCGILAIEAGFMAENGIAELVAAATLHDIGMADVAFDFGARARSRWTKAEREDYQSHVSKGLAVLRACVPKLPENVLRIVSEHHELPDGSGFPAGKKLSELHEGSLLLALADRLDRMLAGEETGEALAPSQAFLRLRQGAIGEGAPEFIRNLVADSGGSVVP